MKPQTNQTFPNCNWRGFRTGDGGTSVAREDEGLAAKKARMPGPYRQVALLIILGSLLSSPVFSQVEPLSPAEIQAAREAMKLFLGNEPAPEELIRSGQSRSSNEPRGFAEFGTPFTDVSDRLKFRQTIFCEFPPAQWRCWRANQGRIGAGDRVFGVGNLDARTVADIVDYLHSQCYTVQATALTKQQGRPSSFPPLIGYLKWHPKGFRMRVFEDSTERFYILERADAKTDGCGFKLLQDPMSIPPEDKMSWAYNALARAMLLGFASVIIIPWIGLIVGWRLRAAAAGYLATGATIAFIGESTYFSGNIRLDLLLFVPPVLLAWINFVAFLYDARNRTAAQAMGSIGKLLFCILAVPNVLALALLLLFLF